MRIAIVGAGISGLTCAHLLTGEHEVVVLEAAPYAGGHTNTITVHEGDRELAVDTGFIVFNDRNYPNFERLLKRLGVASQPSDMGFSVSDEAGRFEYSGSSLNGLFAVRSHLATPSFWRMVLDLARFNREARELLQGESDESLGHWLERKGYSRGFVERLIVPQASAVWSSDPAHMWSFPARFLVAFFHNHGMLGFTGRPGWRVVRGGSRTYVDALVTGLGPGAVRLSSPVTAVSRVAEGGGVEVSVMGRGSERFDEVVLACHSDQALDLLQAGGAATALERELLGAIPFQRNEAVLHTDRRLLPRRRRAWASWNYHLLDRPKPCTTVTYHMNRLQSLDALGAREEYCVTLNRTEAIDPARILRVIEYAHPVFTPEGMRAQARVGEISGVDRVHFCGAYWQWGFHEDGVVSALRVAERLGAARL